MNHFPCLACYRPSFFLSLFFLCIWELYLLACHLEHTAHYTMAKKNKIKWYGKKKKKTPPLHPILSIN